MVLLLLVAISILTAPDHPRVDWDDIGTHVLESDELYFRNIRAYHYYSEMKEEAGFEFLRPKKFVEVDDSERSPFGFAIVLNPLHDAAYLMLEYQYQPIDSAIEIEITNSIGVNSLILNPGQGPDRMVVLRSLFEGLHNEDSKYFIRSKHWEGEIWKSSVIRSTQRTLFKDYFRLVGAL